MKSKNWVGQRYKALARAKISNKLKYYSRTFLGYIDRVKKTLLVHKIRHHHGNGTNVDARQRRKAAASIFEDSRSVLP